MASPSHFAIFRLPRCNRAQRAPFGTAIRPGALDVGQAAVLAAGRAGPQATTWGCQLGILKDPFFWGASKFGNQISWGWKVRRELFSSWGIHMPILIMAHMTRLCPGAKHWSTQHPQPSLAWHFLEISKPRSSDNIDICNPNLGSKQILKSPSIFYSIHFYRILQNHPVLFLWTSKKSRSPLPIPRGSGTRGNVNLPAARSAAVLLRSAFSRPS